MGDNYFAVRPAILTTKEKNPHHFLNSGKIMTTSGFFFYIIEVLCPNNLGPSIKKTLLPIAMSYCDQPISEPFFEKFLEELNESLEIVLQENELNIATGKINSAIGFITGNKIFLSQAGRLPAYLFRKGKISSLTESIDLESVGIMQVFKDVVYGDLIKEDRIILGNNELYNHLSLDRLRKITSEQSAKLANKELFSTFRKLKSNTVNSILMEATNLKESETEVSHPDILYVDEPEDNLLNQWNKKYMPHIKKGLKATGRGIVAFGKFANKHGRKAVGKSSKFIKKAIAKNQDKSSENIKDIKSKNHYNKVKIKNIYERKSYEGGLKFLKIFWQYIVHLYDFFRHKEHRKYLYLCLIIVFITVGFLKIRSNNINRTDIKEKQEIADSYDKANALFKQAKEDFALGKTTSSTQFAEALEVARKGSADESTKDKNLELMKEIQEQIDQIGKITRIYQTGENTTTIGSNISAGLAAGNEIYLFGEDGKTYSYNAQSKESILTASFGKDKGKAKSLSYAESDDEIFVYTTLDMMLYYSITTKSFGSLKTSETEWTKAQSLAVFATNIYFLDSENGQIVKFIKKDGSYSKNSIYADSKKVDLKQSVGIAVDGSVYVLSNNGSVIKFSRSIPDTDFSIKNIPAPYEKIEEPKKIYSSPETNYIYILDSKANRVIRFNKAGEFVSQYSLDGSTISDFIVNDKLKNLWLISGNKITEADL